MKLYRFTVHHVVNVTICYIPELLLLRTYMSIYAITSQVNYVINLSFNKICEIVNKTSPCCTGKLYNRLP